MQLVPKLAGILVWWFLFEKRKTKEKKKKKKKKVWSLMSDTSINMLNYLEAAAMVWLSVCY